MTTEEIRDDEVVELDLPVLDDSVQDIEEFGPRYGQPLPATLPPRNFKPWHRPRKQFVRRMQWVKSFTHLVDEVLSSDPARGDFRYIGLPGSDLIDVRLFADVCSGRGRQLAYLGFDRTAGDAKIDGLYLHLAKDELLKSGKVHRNSTVIRDEFSMLAEVSSLAYKVANDASYDVVNLDLCGSATNMPAGGTFYKALENLLHIQTRREEPWLLLLTAPFDRHRQSTSGKGNVERIYRQLRDDLYKCPEAKEKALEHFALEGQDSLPELVTCDDEIYSRLHILSFVNWLSWVARSARPAYVKFVSIMGYRLNRGHTNPDMFSLAIRITPRQRTIADPAGLLPRPRIAPAHEIVDCAALDQQVERTDRVQDVDSILLKDKDLLAEFRDEMADILEALRYDRKGYLNSEFSRNFDDV